jgi:hypothetical protein
MEKLITKQEIENLKEDKVLNISKRINNSKLATVPYCKVLKQRNMYTGDIEIYVITRKGLNLFAIAGYICAIYDGIKGQHFEKFDNPSDACKFINIIE